MVSMIQSQGGMLPQSRTNSSDNGKPGPELRVVAIGGGTGLSTLLKGLKRYVMTPALATSGQPTIRELCGVVTVSDDGGSSGRLRKELNMLPPGDVRNCIVALSEDEALLSQTVPAPLSEGLGTGRSQLRQSFSGGADFDYRGLCRGGTAFVRNSAHARAYLSGNHVERGTGSALRRRDAGARRDPDHGKQGQDSRTRSWCLPTLSRFPRRWRRSPAPT